MIGMPEMTQVVMRCRGCHQELWLSRIQALTLPRERLTLCCACVLRIEEDERQNRLQAELVARGLRSRRRTL